MTRTGIGRRRRGRTVLAVLAVLALLATACGDGDDDAAPAGGERPPTVTVRVATTPNLANPGPLLIAQKRGWFAEQGIELDMKVLDLNEIVGSVASGGIDVVTHTMWAGMYNAMLNTETRIVAAVGAVDRGHAPSGIVLRKGLAGTVREPKDLRGRTVAHCGLNGACEYLVERFLQQGGLTTKDVKLVQLTFAEIAPAMANGAVDAALIAEPLYSAGIKQGAFVDFMRSDRIYPVPFTTTVMYYSGDFRTKKNDVAERFMVAALRGMRAWTDALVHGGPEATDTIALLGNAKPLIPVDVATIEALKASGGVDSMDPTGYGRMDTGPALLLAWMQGRSLVDTSLTIDRVVDTSFLDKANEKLGAYRAPGS